MLPVFLFSCSGKGVVLKVRDSKDKVTDVAMYNAVRRGIFVQLKALAGELRPLAAQIKSVVVQL